MLAGALMIVAAVATAQLDGTQVEVLGLQVSPMVLFLLGVGSGVAILWGFGIVRFGTRRSLKHRREAKQLEELSQKLEAVEAERRKDDE